MTKQEVLSYMEKRLEILNKNERKDILAEYSQHIENKMESGLTEEEAISDFGDIDQFIDDILDAYKVDPDYQHKKITFEYTISRFLKKFGKIVTAIADEIANRNKRELAAMVFQFLIVVLVLIIAKIPVNMMLDLTTRIFNALPQFMSGFLNAVVAFCISVVYLIVFCYTVYIFIKKTLLANYDFDSEIDREYAEQAQNSYQYEETTTKRRDSEATEKKTGLKNKIFRRKEQRNTMTEPNEPNQTYEPNEAYEQNPSDTADYDVVGIVKDADENGELPSDESVLDSIKERAKRTQQAAPAPKAKSGGFGDFLLNLFAICLKVLVVIMILPVAAIGLCIIVGFGILFSLMLQGLPLVGATIATFGLLLCTIAFVVAVLKLLFKGGATNE